MANSGADTNGSQFFINATGGMSADWDYYQQGFDVYEQSPEGPLLLYLGAGGGYGIR